MPRNCVASWPLTLEMRTFGLALTIVAVLVGACTSSTQSASVSPKASPSASPTAAAPTLLCFTDPPSDWALAMSHVIATLEGVNFGVGAIDEQNGVAYGGAWMSSQQEIASFNLSSGKMTEVAPMSPNGFGWMTYGDDWLVWPEIGIGGSFIRLWNSRTQESRQIATSGKAGTAVVGNGHVVWTDAATSATNGLRVYDLATAKTATLDTGLLRPPVFAGKFLVWAKQVSSADNPSFVFADATTLQPVAAPAELRAAREISYLAGSADYLVWTGSPKSSSPDNGRWFVDDLAVAVTRTYSGRNHYFQFPQLAGSFLVWFGADKNSIVDLRSGIGIDIPLPGGVEAAGDTIVVDRVSTLKANVTRTDVSVLHPSQLSRLQIC